MENNIVLDVRNISISFSQYDTSFKRRQLSVINDLSVKIHEGEILAVVGASGSGKSLLAHAILGILPYNASMNGDIFYLGKSLNINRIMSLRGKEIVLVPQCVSYLDPLMKVGPQIRKNSRNKNMKIKTAAVLKRYGLERNTEDMYPFELSGGMARRVLIGTAVMESPKLIIADEPTPGLHIDVAKRVLGHFREIADKGAAVLLITHDLELAVQTANRVVVFHSGNTIEEAAVSDFEDAKRLRHPYTRDLWRAMPNNGFQVMEDMSIYEDDIIGGCPFRYRCSTADEMCIGSIPYRSVRGGYVRCVKEDYDDIRG